MSERPDEHPAHHDDELLGEGVARGVSRLVGWLFVDELANGAVFFSLLLIVGAVITLDPPLVALGAAVGLVGMIAPWRGMHQRWSASTMFLLAVTVLVVDAATGWVLWHQAG